jgi:hypothetical protein
MAVGIQQRGPQQFPWATPSGTGVSAGGMTAAELKVHQGVVPEKIEAQPIAQRGPVEFIAPTTSSEQLRLAVPTAANPYATPTGPKHDHMLVRKALARSHEPVAGDLVGLLKQNPSGIGQREASQMRASLAREHAMLGLLQNMQEMQEHIYGRIIGSQEA